MQKWILWLLLSTLVTSSTMAETDCSTYEAKIRKLEDLRRQGGSLKQMSRWRAQMEELTSKKFSCKKESAIQFASGDTTSTSKPKAIKSPKTKLRKSNSQDPQIQQLLSTCNYWITEQNNNPSDDNSNFSNTACRALDQKLAIKEVSSPVEVINVRSLKDCIKPNNLIDNEVQECRQGLRDPIWKH